MPAKVAVVIPAYKEELNELEKISLAQCRKVLGKYPLIFFAPERAQFQYFAPTDGIAYFPPPFFQSVRTYNQLMKLPTFYSVFKDFEYILLYQLDAFVFYDALEYFCSLGYDYIGAPWPAQVEWFRNTRRIKSRVGNGGFSLRKVEAHYNLLVNHSDLVNMTRNKNEDDFYSLCGQVAELNFRVAPYDVACKFSAEIDPRRVVKKNGGKLPFGCHAWFKYDGDFYAPIFEQLGYDLSSVRDKLHTADYEKMLFDGLTDEATKRLGRRINRGRSLMRYLPRKDFASVRVVRSPFAMMILARLLLENPQLADSIHLYEPDERDLLLHDLDLSKKPHLLIHVGGGDMMN